MNSSRKRNAKEAELDPNTFVDNYLSERSIKKTTTYHNSELQRNVYQRAIDAREDYKRLRTGPSEPTTDPVLPAAEGLTESILTPADKYNRRLKNNRKSAAASRVFQQVHMYETAYTLNEVVARSEQLENESASHKKRADILEEENKQIRDDMLNLRTMLTASQLAPPKKDESNNFDAEIQRLKDENATLRSQLEDARTYTPDHGTAPDIMSSALPVPSMPSKLHVIPIAPTPATFAALAPLPNEARVLPPLFRASQETQRYSQSQEDDDTKPLLFADSLRRAPTHNTALRFGSQEQNILRASFDFDASQNPVLCSQDTPTGRGSLNFDEFTSNDADFFALPSAPSQRVQSQLGIAAS